MSWFVSENEKRIIELEIMVDKLSRSEGSINVFDAKSRSYRTCSNVEILEAIIDYLGVEINFPYDNTSAIALLNLLIAIVN